MEISLNKAELAGALPALGKLVCRSSPIQVYRAVQIEANNNTLFFRTHSMDEEIEYRIEAEGLDAFKVIMEFDFFRSLVRNCRNKSIKIEFTDGKLHIDGVAVVPIEGEWPVTEVPQGDNVTTSPLPWKFVEELAAAAPLIDLDNPRKILRGINLSTDGITATNNKELFNRPYRFNLDDLTIPFPLALMASKAGGIGTLTAWDTGLFTMFSVKLARWTWTAKALPGEYPNWKPIVPKRSDLKHSVCFTMENADRLKFFLKSVGDKRPSNEIRLYRKAGHFTMQDGDGHEFGILASFNSGWDDFSITVKKEILMHLLNEGHTEIRFGDGMSPFVANGGIGQFIAMPMRPQAPQAEASQEATQTTSGQMDVQAAVQAEQPAPEAPEQKTETNTNITNTTPSTKENTTMNDNSIHTVSAPVQTSAQNHEPEQNPLDELMANIEAMKTKLKAMFDDSAVLSRKVREVALAQRQKEREYVQTKRTIERIRTASGF